MIDNEKDYGIQQGNGSDKRITTLETQMPQRLSNSCYGIRVFLKQSAHPMTEKLEDLSRLLCLALFYHI